MTPRDAVAKPPILLTLKEMALALSVSESWLRASDCPRYVIPTHGKAERAMIRFSPDETRQWVGQWHQRAATRPELARSA